MSNYLGKGAYGTVRKVAQKEFTEIPFIIQEYVCLRYLRECEHVVSVLGVDLNSMVITTELHDSSLAQRIKTLTTNERNQVAFQILKGLTELHDRDMVHADLKPGNMLVSGKGDEIKLVICDLGFTSITKYAKIRFTTSSHKDPNEFPDKAFDLYSLGVCLVELFSGQINKSPTCDHLIKSIYKEHERWKPIISALLSKDRSSRPSTREILSIIYNHKPKSFEVNPDVEEAIYNVMDTKLVKEYLKTLILKKDGKVIKTGMNRTFKLLQALCEFLIRKDQYHNFKRYTLMGSVICCCMFMESYWISTVDVESLDSEDLAIITELITDDIFVGILMYGSNPK